MKSLRKFNLKKIVFVQIASFVIKYDERIKLILETFQVSDIIKISATEYLSYQPPSKNEFANDFNRFEKKVVVTFDHLNLIQN